ncbi:MAG: hypothetical protein Q8L47_02640 [bacterium]|nr:hypothetical protein [bacterium]
MAPGRVSLDDTYKNLQHLEKLSDRYFYIMIITTCAAAFSLGIVIKSFFVGAFIMFALMSIQAAINLASLKVKISIIEKDLRNGDQKYRT